MNRTLSFGVLICVAAVGWAQPLFAQHNAPDTTVVYELYQLDKAPAFPGGESEMLKFLSGTPYPPMDSTMEIVGTLAASFIIEIDGGVSDICALIHPNHPWVRAFMRRVATMPPFSPGEKGGRPVRIRYVLIMHIRPE